MKEAERENGIQITEELINEFLADMQEKGRSSGSLDVYRRALLGLLDYLAVEGILQERTGTLWCERLAKQGLSESTINTQISVFNSFMRYLGKKGWQIDRICQNSRTAQPELTRLEYLRLLSAAKQSGQEKSYLIIKTLGSAGLRAQELSQLTAEAVESGTTVLSSHNGLRQRELHIPHALRKELADYMKRENIKSGPLFLSEEGRPMSRSTVHHYVSAVSSDARVEPEKANPRCLYKMYCSAREELEANIKNLLDQAYEQMLEQEQVVIGWEKG